MTSYIWNAAKAIIQHYRKPQKHDLFNEGYMYAEKIWSTSPESVARLTLVNKIKDVDNPYDKGIVCFLEDHSK